MGVCGAGAVCGMGVYPIGPGIDVILASCASCAVSCALSKLLGGACWLLLAVKCCV